MYNLENCDDGIQNQDETAIDCGGVCGKSRCSKYFVSIESNASSKNIL